MLYQIKIDHIHDSCDFHKLMFSFFGKELFKKIKQRKMYTPSLYEAYSSNINYFGYNKEYILLANINRNIFTFSELKRFKFLLEEYEELHKYGLLSYSVSDILLPEEMDKFFNESFK